MLTLSNRETFLVLHWLEDDLTRRARLRDLARELAAAGGPQALEAMTAALIEDVEAELPHLDGLPADLVRSGLHHVRFEEMALALLADEGADSVGPQAKPS